jgi:tRNA(fMet)-specific endonuclease VapC
VTVRFLLDTNILSEPLKPTPSATVMGRLKAHSGELGTASVVWGELVYGVERMPQGKRRVTVEGFLSALRQSDLEVLPYDQAAADWHGRERARLEAAGVPRPFVDSQIAAVARRHGVTLVTRNVTDFQHFEGLQLENWFD